MPRRGRWQSERAKTQLPAPLPEGWAAEQRRVHEVPPPGARHALTDAEKRNPRGWFHESIGPELAATNCFWCLRPFGSGPREQTGRLADGHLICDGCATGTTR